jgi:hypothetical protein
MGANYGTTGNTGTGNSGMHGTGSSNYMSNHYNNYNSNNMNTTGNTMGTRNTMGTAGSNMGTNNSMTTGGMPNQSNERLMSAHSALRSAKFMLQSEMLRTEELTDQLKNGRIELSASSQDSIDEYSSLLNRISTENRRNTKDYNLKSGMLRNTNNNNNTSNQNHSARIEELIFTINSNLVALDASINVLKHINLELSNGMTNQGSNFNTTNTNRTGSLTNTGNTGINNNMGTIGNTTGTTGTGMGTINNTRTTPNVGGGAYNSGTYNSGGSTYNTGGAYSNRTVNSVGYRGATNNNTYGTTGYNTSGNAVRASANVDEVNSPLILQHA